MNRHTTGLLAVLALLTSTAAFAHGDGDHTPKTRPYVASQVVDTPFGRQGDPRKVTRTIAIQMGDNMRFTPSALTVKRGETVRLKVTNRGQLLHELVLGTEDALKAHAEAMRKHPGMVHDDPSMVHVAAGATGEIVWQFHRAGEFSFACLLPGHFEAGMTGKVVVQ
ncbi:MAG: cupredoxin family protein [Pelomonas sp.]|nr:cupredoxin family protein [Roseateles sp.]